MPRRCSVGARLSSTGCSRITSSRMSHTSGPACSTIFFAALMVVARPLDSSLGSEGRRGGEGCADVCSSDLHRMLADHLFQNVPYLGTGLFDHLLRRLDGGGEALGFELGVGRAAWWGRVCRRVLFRSAPDARGSPLPECPIPRDRPVRPSSSPP